MAGQQMQLQRQDCAREVHVQGSSALKIACIVFLITESTHVAPKLDRIGQGKELLELCKVLIPVENSPWLNA